MIKECEEKEKEGWNEKMRRILEQQRKIKKKRWRKGKEK